MSAVVVFGLLWVAAGVVVGLRWWSERGLGGARQAEVEGPANARFGQVREDGSRRRRLAMRRAYAVGAALVVVGLVTAVPVVLALGAAMVNLGTIYRYLVVVLDLEAVDTPLLVRSPGAAHLSRRGLRGAALPRGLVARLAD